jgi:predicted nucleotidyltransferase component of viral defense system
LEFIGSQNQITKRFYLTGGTALAEFYLHHRFSEDIDLFTEGKEVYFPSIDAFLKKNSPKLQIKKFDRTQFLGLISYHLEYKDGSKLKVDFNYYPFPRIEKGLKLKNLNIDSLIDIATNKVHTLFMKPRTRDYIDLYFIFKKEKFDLNKLILLAKAKFDWNIDKINLANQFIRVKDIKLEDYPKVLVPFKISEMEKFFLDLANDLKKDIFH